MRKRIAKLSPGQRQRLAILAAIGHEPSLLLLDEPAAALDPIARMQFLDLLVAMIQDATRTIIISSHILSDVGKIIDHAIIMDRGRILVDCAFDELQERFCRLRVSGVTDPLPETLPIPEILECERDGNTAAITLEADAVSLLADLESRTDWQVERLPLSLEDIYRLVLSRCGRTGALRPGGI